MIEIEDENLAVANATGFRSRCHSLHYLVGDGIIDRYLDFHFGHKIHDVFGPTINLGMAPLTAIAFDLGDGHAVDADPGEGVTDLIKLEGFDDRGNKLHGDCSLMSKFFSL